MVAGPRADGMAKQIVFVQILLFLVGLRGNFINFVGVNGTMAVRGRPGLFNNDCAFVMVTVKIGKHTVEMYDGIEELPIVRFHKYQKLLLVESGVGSDIAAFDQRIEKARRFVMSGDNKNAQQELENLRQCVFMIQNEISPKHRAFAALVTKIDGREYKDISDESLEEIIHALNDAPLKELAARLDAVKKKIDDELTLYFPGIFNNSEIKEYYDLLKKRTLAMLKKIVEGVPDPENDKDVDRITTALITYSQPRTFAGSESAEIQHDRQFENLCLALSEQLHVKPKEYSVLEFYNAFDFLQERAKAAEKARKRA